LSFFQTIFKDIRKTLEDSGAFPLLCEENLNDVFFPQVEIYLGKIGYKYYFSNWT